MTPLFVMREGEYGRCQAYRLSQHLQQNRHPHDARPRIHALELNHLSHVDFGMSLAFSVSDGTEIPNGDCSYGSDPISLASAATCSFCSLCGGAPIAPK